MTRDCTIIYLFAFGRRVATNLVTFRELVSLALLRIVFGVGDSMLLF